MRVEDILAKLQKVREVGQRSWVACCPAHDDHNPSLSVSEQGGKILMHCHAGCTNEDVCAALGIGVRDLFEDDLRGGRRAPSPKGGRSAVTHSAVPTPAPAGASKKKSGGHGRLVCEYIYRDPAGGELFKVGRYVRDDGKKSFIAFRRVEGGKWEWGIHDRSGGKEKLLVPYVAPYHLPQLVKAAKAGRSLVIVEGEKDVATVEAMGLAATCNPFGASKWGIDWPENWGEWFQGIKSILIVADRDPETVKRKVRGKVIEKPFLVGQKHAVDVREKLKAAGVKCPIRLICLPPVGEKSVKDFTDWADARTAAGLAVDKAALAAAIEEFGEWPAFWDFTAEDLSGLDGVARAEKKGARDSASSEPGEVAPAEKSGGRDAADLILERFGRLRAPRTPAENVETYEVDFRLSARRVVRLSVDCNMRLPDAMGIMCGRVRAKMGDGESLSAELVRNIQVIVCLLWLRSRGRFFWDANFKSFETSLYFDRKRGELMKVRDAEFLAWLATEADVNRKSRTFEYIMAMIDDAALSPEASQGVVPANSWERRGDAVYISSGDAEMWRIRGGAVDKVQNGTDGVVFMRKRTLAPWRMMDGPGIDPFVSAKIFTGASWSDPVNGRMNVRLWVLNLFAEHRMKPALLITGPFQSGKTRMALAIKQVLGMRWDDERDERVNRMEDGDRGEDSFWVAVNAGKVEVFDNVDSRVKWMGDALQIALTGGSSPRRKKYSDSETINLRANASLILTSNNPMFATEGGGGLADRLIAVHLTVAAERESLDDEISLEIDQNRNQYMTWIARTLAKALADGAAVDKSINKRHPAYGRFSVKCGRAFGDEMGAIGALGSAEADKSLLPLINDTVGRQIMRVLAAANYEMKFTAGEMSEKILAIQGDESDEKTAGMYSARRVGKAISRYLTQLTTLLQMDKPRVLQGRTIYEVRGVRGVSARSLLVGMVGFGTAFPESSIQESVGEFSQNGVRNAPNPPSRACADDVSFSREEEEGIETMAEMEGFELV